MHYYHICMYSSSCYIVVDLREMVALSKLKLRKPQKSNMEAQWSRLQAFDVFGSFSTPALDGNNARCRMQMFNHCPVCVRFCWHQLCCWDACDWPCVLHSELLAWLLGKGSMVILFSRPMLFHYPNDSFWKLLSLSQISKLLGIMVNGNRWFI